MSERPIIFSAPMVRAILAGRKTQTRRIVKPHPPIGTRSVYRPFPHELNNWQAIGTDDLMCWYGHCSYGSEGDTLWVRETWLRADAPAGRIIYAADYAPADVPQTRWRPSIHMPRVAARLFLRVTSVRVERLQDISEDDANAEGVDLELVHRLGGAVAFRELWDSLNAERAPWASNPYVWVVSFERVPGQSDAS